PPIDLGINRFVARSCWKHANPRARCIHVSHEFLGRIGNGQPNRRVSLVKRRSARRKLMMPSSPLARRELNLSEIVKSPQGVREEERAGCWTMVVHYEIPHSRNRLQTRGSHSL